MSPLEFAGYIPPVVRTVLLASAQRVGNQQVLLENPGWKSCSLWLSVTANPGAAETISIVLATELPAGGIFSLVSTPASALGGIAGTLAIGMGPGVSAAWPATASAFLEAVLPPAFVFSVIVSAAGVWEYDFILDAHF